MTDQDAKQRERIMEKIRKCFALGKSSEPHEAAAAIRQAQKLMEAYNISQDEIMGMEVRDERVVTPEPPKRKMPLYLTSIVMICCRAFGCEAVFEWHITDEGRRRQAVRYFGKNNAPVMAGYAHEVMWRAMMRSWKLYVKDNPYDINPNDRGSFWIGWLSGVEQKIIDFAMTDEEKETIKRKMDKTFGKLEQTDIVKPKEVSTRAARAGHNAAEDFDIHRPMGGSSGSPDSPTGPKLLGKTSAN